jgi:hypothetical protein
MFVRLGLIALIASAGCEKTTHDNIDKWKSTEKGPAKLAKAVGDDALDADLSAHAGANLVRIGRDGDLRSTLERMPGPRREQVIADLAPKLWDIARIDGELELPKTTTQIAAKDSLIAIRKWASAATRQQIDGYLIDWYCVPSYDDAKGGGRAVLGNVRGDVAMRTVGAPAAKKLMEIANGVVAAPGQDKVKNRIGDELLVALAATCTPETVKYVLDTAKLQRGDTTLAARAMSALYKAYVKAGGEFEECDRAPLLPNLDALVAIAKDDHLSGAAADDAVSLVGAVGTPKCMPPLVGMIPHPHSNPSFKYVTAQAALRCGGPAAIAEVVHALPDGPYDDRQLQGGVTGEIAKLSPRDQVLAAVRPLLDDRRVLVRWVAIDTLAGMKSVEDAPRLAAIKSTDRLGGFWGDQSDLPAKSRKPDPTLGQHAKELADQLQKPPK